MARHGASTLFGEEAVLPEQFHRSESLSPERALLLALIASAGNDLQGYKPRTAMHRNARFWIEDRRRYPFSFEYCCEILGLDASAMRRGLLALPPRSGRPPMNRIAA